MTQFNAETADAVDRFRADHGLPVPQDGLGHDSGIVDREFVAALRAAHAAEVVKSRAAADQVAE